MATFGGASIFGRAVKVSTVRDPVERQENGYSGLNGVESLSLGSRGGMTTVIGLLTGAATSDLEAAEETIRSYNDGIARTLVDSYGISWVYVVLVDYQPQGRIVRDPYRGYCRPYVARFRHLY